MLINFTGSGQHTLSAKHFLPISKGNPIIATQFQKRLLRIKGEGEKLGIKPIRENWELHNGKETKISVLKKNIKILPTPTNYSAFSNVCMVIKGVNIISDHPVDYGLSSTVWH